MKKDTTEFRLGDFARLQADNPSYIGIITEIERQFVIEYPLGGYPLDLCMVSKGNPSSIIKVTTQEALHHYQARSSSLEKQVEIDCKTKYRPQALRAGIRARERYYFDLMIQELEMAKSPLQRYRAMKTALPPTRTGVYVMEGYYLNEEGNYLSTCQEGLLTSPRLSESVAEDLLWVLAPKGFGNIHRAIKGTQGKPKSSYHLEGYSAYELPKDAIELVKERNPKRIDLTSHLG